MATLETCDDSSAKHHPAANPDMANIFGPPLHQLPELVQRSINEKDCSITEFVSPGVNGFSAIIKHRYSDFNVFEISSDDTVVHLKNLDIPKEKVPDFDAECVVLYNDLSAEDKALVSALTWARIVHVAKKYFGDGRPSESEVVNIDATGLDKEQRKRIHVLIRTYFPHLSSGTGSANGQDGKSQSVVAVQYRTKKKGTWEWPRERPKFLQFTLYKEDLDQHQVLALLGSRLNSQRDKFGIAGTKDKRARTSQKVTVPLVTPQKLVNALTGCYNLAAKAAVGDFEYVKEPLKLGKSNGNRFCIILRNITESDDVLAAAFNSLSERGFVNYFGLQRFGTSAILTSDIGLALIRHQWDKVAEMIMMPRANERPDMKKTREFWWQYRDPATALKMLGRRNENLLEGKLLMGLRDSKKNDSLGALNCIQKNVRLMYLHAYQSRIFNRVVSMRMAKHGLQVLLGDLYLPVQESIAILSEIETKEEDSGLDEKNLPEVKKVTTENIDSVSIYEVLMPLPGSKVTYPDNEIKSMYESVLAEDELTFDCFKSSTGTIYSLGGSYRPMLARPTDLQWEVVKYSNPDQNLVLSDLERVKRVPPIKSKPDGTYKGVVIDFSLRSSQYATMALREALKVDTGKAAQSAMTDCHRGEKRVAGAEAETTEMGEKRAKVEGGEN